MLKTCSQCKIAKTYEEFNSFGKKRSRPPFPELRPNCKKCHSKYYFRDRAHHRELTERWRKAHLDRHAEANKRWREKKKLEQNA